MALPKPYRLRERKEFSRVYRRGKRFGGPNLLLRIAPQAKTLSPKPLVKSSGQSSGLKQVTGSAQADRSSADRSQANHNQASTNPSRIAVVVSTKVHKRAVVRNRIRRQIQAAFQSLLADLAPGKLLVVTVKASAVECDYYEFLQQLEQLLSKAEALHGH